MAILSVANKSLHRTATPLCSIAAGELGVIRAPIHMKWSHKLSRKYINVVVAIAFSIFLVFVWERVVGILSAIAIPDNYVKNADGSYTGNMYVILLWDFLVIHLPALLIPCFILSFPFRIWVVRSSALIFWSFLFVFLLRYLYSMITVLPVLFPPSVLKSIYIMMPTPYPILGVLLGVWLGLRLDRSKNRQMV